MLLWRKVSWGGGNREHAQVSVCVFVMYSKVVRKSLTEVMTVEQQTKENEGASQLD